MFGWLKGKKTYITGAGLILWGVFEYVTGDQASGANHVLEGVGLMTLRAGITKGGGS